MLRVILALLCVTTIASAAMPFAVPSLAIPAPTIPEQRAFAGCAGVPSGRFNYRPIWYSPDSGLLESLPVQSIVGLIELFGSEERYRTALNASRVEVVRLAYAVPNAVNPGDYAESEPVKLVGWQAGILQRALTADSSYIWDTELTERSECIPTYEIRIRLQHGDKTLTAEFSLSSRMIRILEGNTFISEQPLSERGFGLLLFLEPS